MYLILCFICLNRRYTNDINPFGDPNLTEQFVWGKKKEKEGTANQELSKRDLREMRKEKIDEIEKVLPRSGIKAILGSKEKTLL